MSKKFSFALALYLVCMASGMASDVSREDKKGPTGPAPMPIIEQTKKKADQPKPIGESLTYLLGLFDALPDQEASRLRKNIESGAAVQILKKLSRQGDAAFLQATLQQLQTQDHNLVTYYTALYKLVNRLHPDGDLNRYITGQLEELKAIYNGNAQGKAVFKPITTQTYNNSNTDHHLLPN